MKDLKRSARTLNTILNVLFWLLLARGAYAAVFHAIALGKIFSDPAALSGKMGLTVDWLTIEAANGFGITMDAAIPMKLIQLVSAVIITVIACRGIAVLKRVLLPIEVGQPFLPGIARNIQDLANLALWMGFAENFSMLLSQIIIEQHYDLPALLINDVVTGVAVRPQFRPAWFIVTAILSILAMVFRRGEELQQLSDETL